MSHALVAELAQRGRSSVGWWLVPSSSRRASRWFALLRRAIVALALAVVTGVYLSSSVSMLNLRVERQIEVTGHPFIISDLFPRWLGAQAMLSRQNPYSETFRADLHRYYYGAPRSREWEQEVFRSICEFFYPPFVVLPLLPLLPFPFAVVSPVATLALAVALVTASWLWLRLLDVPFATWRVGAYSVATLAFLPSLDLLLLQQLTGLVLLYLVGACWFAAKRRFVLAGILLALAMIKPQSAVVLSAGMLTWALWRRERWGMPAAFAATMIGQFALSETLVPGWVPQFLAANERYRAYNSIGFWLPGQVFGSNLAGAVGLAAPSVAFAAWLWWRARKAPAASPQVVTAAGMALALTPILMPDISYYNKVLLLPAILSVLTASPPTGGATRPFRRFALLGLGAAPLMTALAAGCWILTNAAALAGNAALAQAAALPAAMLPRLTAVLGMTLPLVVLPAAVTLSLVGVAPAASYPHSWFRVPSQTT